ncbi:hypothetical protein ABPG73_010812 [Tetrahymena malaccensis]
MEQQISSFNNLTELMKSNFKALTSIDLQLKNFDFDSKQLDTLNTSLKKCYTIESLVLNLQQECIQDDQLNPFFVDYKWLIDLIPNFNNMSNDQRYSLMQFLLKNYGFDELSIQPKKSQQISVVGDFLQDDTVSNLINLKRLELNLRYILYKGKYVVWKPLYIIFFNIFIFSIAQKIFDQRRGFKYLIKFQSIRKYLKQMKAYFTIQILLLWKYNQ